LFSPTDGGVADTSAAVGPVDVSNQEARRSCEVAPDGTCVATMPDTSCMPVIGQLYDQAEACVTRSESTLYCVAFPSRGLSGLAPFPNCYRASGDAGAPTFRTTETDPRMTNDHACSAATAEIVASAPWCSSPADAAPDAVKLQCLSRSDGSCYPTTPATTCLPFTGRPYDRAHGCISPTDITLYCAASADSAPAGFASAPGCYRGGSGAEEIVYWTGGTDPGDAQALNHTCATEVAATLSVAPTCVAP